MNVDRSAREHFLILDRIEVGGRELTLVRDDLFPEPGGGSKARKALEYEKDVAVKGANALVTTGGVQSNHCRAMAVIAARRRWKLHVVYHGSRERFDAEKGNAELVRKTNATYEFVEANQISAAMDAAMERFRRSGDVPYYVTGGGHDVPGGSAFVKAVVDLKEECARRSWKPSVVFHASGTGSTQAGLIVGFERIGWGDVPIVGISVARKQERGAAVVAEFVKRLAQAWNVASSCASKVRFCDDFLCGGYEQTTPELTDFLSDVARDTGVFFDSTYSGKALWGATRIMNERLFDLDCARPLFWHTGGLMNLMK